MEIKRKNKNLVPNGTKNGVEIFQDSSDNLLYYKDVNGTLKPLISIPEYTYKEVAITKEEILAWWSTPIDLLPILTSGYYTFKEIILEYTHVTTDYGIGEETYFSVSNGGGTHKVSVDMLSISENNTIVLKQDGITTDGILNVNTLGQALQIAGVGGNVTGGDGTILVKILYKVNVFGTEL